MPTLVLLTGMAIYACALWITPSIWLVGIGGIIMVSSCLYGGQVRHVNGWVAFAWSVGNSVAVVLYRAFR